MKRVKHFGRCLTLLREREGMTRAKLAQKSGISAAYVGRLEKGEVWPGLNVLDGLASSLGMTAGEMLVGVDKATKAYEDLLKAEAALLAAFGGE